MRFRQHQVLEEGIRHVDVVMLAGVNDLRRGPIPLFEGVIKRGDLHEVGTRGSDEMDFF